MADKKANQMLENTGKGFTEVNNLQKANEILENRRRKGKNGRHLLSRLIECFGLEGTLNIIWFHPHCHRQGHLPQKALL